MKLIQKEFLFFIFLSLVLILIYINPKEIYNINNYIDYSTIRALIVLLLLTTAMQLSNLFDFLAIKFIKLFTNERHLALFFIYLSIVLSMFLTNDITLFIIIPLTLAISNKLQNNDFTKLIIFEAIATNVGSLLTPIGNPQNLYLFRLSHISFFGFIHNMFPLFIIQFILLSIFAYFNFKNKSLKINANIEIIQVDKFLFFSSFLFFIIYIFALENHFVKLLIPIVILWFLFIKKEVFFKFDYFLILTFSLMFIDFHIIANFGIVNNLISKLTLDFLNIFNLSILLSQIMSNVPATIFISQFSDNYQAIAYGVNLAGSGLIISSLANIIAVRFLNNSKGYIIYHKYGIPYFIISYIFVYLLLIK